MLRKITEEELDMILKNHIKYLENGDESLRAHLSDVDLSGANLKGAKLKGINLNGAEL